MDVDGDVDGDVGQEVPRVAHELRGSPWRRTPPRSRRKSRLRCHTCTVRSPLRGLMRLASGVEAIVRATPWFFVDPHGRPSSAGRCGRRPDPRAPSAATPLRAGCGVGWQPARRAAGANGSRALRSVRVARRGSCRRRAPAVGRRGDRGGRVRRRFGRRLPDAHGRHLLLRERPGQPRAPKGELALPRVLRRVIGMYAARLPAGVGGTRSLPAHVVPCPEGAHARDTHQLGVCGSAELGELRVALPHLDDADMDAVLWRAWHWHPQLRVLSRHARRLHRAPRRVPQPREPAPRRGSVPRLRRLNRTIGGVGAIHPATSLRLANPGGKCAPWEKARGTRSDHPPTGQKDAGALGFPRAPALPFRLTHVAEALHAGRFHVCKSARGRRWWFRSEPGRLGPFDNYSADFGAFTIFPPRGWQDSSARSWTATRDPRCAGP